MNAAIYARKSTEQKDVAEEAKSVTRQVDNAKAFAATKGWTVADTHVFIDDGISGAEFKKRPGFQRLMAALTPRPPFAVLIVSEQKSIGREMSETGYVIKQLAQAGVEIVEYMHGRSLTPKTWLDKAMSAVQSAADEAHREATSERVHEAHTRLHKLGRVTGGRVFGYKNFNVYPPGADPLTSKRSHVVLHKNPIEEAVVRRIFEMADSGLGLKRIVKQLTADHAPVPEPFKRTDGLRPVGGWSPSTVRGILGRELYHGVIVWNQSRKRPVTWGQVDQRPRPESDWMRTPAEHLRIVSEPLWLRVQSRRAETEGKAVRFASGRISGRPPKNAIQNLLAGLATCAVCGGGLVVETSPRKRGRVPEYVCHRRRTNGTCTNTLHVPVAEMNEAILTAIEEHALTAEAIEQVVCLTERDDVRDAQATLDRERKDIEKRIGRLVTAIETGGDAASLVAKLRVLEARRSANQTEAASLQPVPRLAPAVIETRLAEWRRLLRQSTTQSRTVLQRVLCGRLTFTPRADGSGYDFSGPTRYDKLFTGLVVSRPAFIAEGQTGADGIGPEDTGEGDYGRLLERAYACGIPGLR